MASTLTKGAHARRYLQASMEAGYTGLPKEHRDSKRDLMREHEREYPGVRRHALAGSRRHFDKPLEAGERGHQAHLREQEGLGEGQVHEIQRELDDTGEPRRATRQPSVRRASASGPARAAAAGAGGAIAEATGGGGNTVMWVIGGMLLLVLAYLLLQEGRPGEGKGTAGQLISGVTGLVTGGVRAFVAPVDPIAAAERALGAGPITAASSSSSGGSSPSAPAAKTNTASGASGLFPGSKYTVGRTDAGKDYSGIQGNIGALAPGQIASVHNYSGFGTTIFEKLRSAIAGKRYAYYALETGGAYSGARGAVAAGTPIARGTGGVIEVGLSSTADVTGIEQRGGGETPFGQAIAKALGAP
jgi:hypothetical protein